MEDIGSLTRQRLLNIKLSGVPLEAKIIQKREIHLAVPAQTNAAQRQQLQRVIEYGNSRNVEVKITEIK